MARLRDNPVLRACPYCGGIHAGDCPNKPKRDYRRERGNESDSRRKERKFRSSKEWQRARAEALERDKHLCRLCLEEDGYISVGQTLDVHHIEPLHKAWSKRTTTSNLITLCKRHHYMADHGEYSPGILKALAVSPLGIEKKK